MKLTIIKNSLLAVIRVFGFFLWLITSYMQRRVTQLMVCSPLMNPYLPKTKPLNCSERECAVQQILSMWEKKSNWTVANDRRRFEATEWGQQVARDNPDRHLYAVLYPTRKENLARIANVLRAMDAEAFARVMRNAEKIRCDKH
ncbi:MAG: hypothetical protein PHQ35_05970 [Phycisphaerae bacterium]|nr:hypothetical protein [Phycisphaerae bacterium]MDD5381275.1 hypothetical protein [Phycisphaerae bacterium]